MCIRDSAVSDRKFPPVCGQVHAAGEELIVLEILGEIQSQIQPVDVYKRQVFLVTWNFFIAVNLQNSIVRQSRWIKMVPAVAPPVSLRVADDE